MAKSPSAKLASYRAKRDFDLTAEPEGRERRNRRGAALAFVVQKHAARHLHYDLRLELDGVMKSWAVAKGPSLVPGEKRLAIHVEDHPLDYNSFEGVIPAGQYGGGTVLLWDRGCWLPEGDPREGYEKGHLAFRLEGEKLKGGWHLVRMKQRPGERRDNWLLIKQEDGHARPPDAPDILEEEPRSVASGRTIEEIAAGAAGAAPAEVAGLRLTHPDRVLWPDEGITKRDLAEFYEEVAGHLLPHVSGRPLALVRCPQGIAGTCFFQKHPWAGLSDHIRHETIRDEAGEEEEILFVRDLPGVVALVQAGVIEIHPWGATIADVENADRIVMDLDPGEGTPWEAVVAAAREVRERLSEAGLESFVKTTGGKGLHVVAPLTGPAPWPAAKAFARSLADAMEADDPRRYVATASKEARRGLVYVDYLRNGRGATAVAPYSARARPGAPVAVPLAWGELDDSLRPALLSVRTVPNRLKTQGSDPWRDLAKLRQRLPGGPSPRAGRGRS